MNKFEQGLKNVGKVALGVVDGKYVAEALTWTEKAAAVLATAVQDQPQLKTALTTLVQKAEAIGSDAAIDVAGKGLNLTADAKSLAEAEGFFEWILSTLVPLIESLYAEVKTDLATSPAASPATAS